MTQKFYVHTDGGARGNPGPGAIGVAVKDKNGKIVKEVGKFIGRSTNNEAEYKAVIEGLKTCQILKADELEFYIDSLLVASQLNGKYKVKNPRMKNLFNEAKKLEQNFKKVVYTHVPREENFLADNLVNEVLDSM
jgi:ribonuclease HI